MSPSWFKFVSFTKTSSQKKRKDRKHSWFCILRNFCQNPLVQLCIVGLIVTDKLLSILTKHFTMFSWSFSISWLWRGLLLLFLSYSAALCGTLIPQPGIQPIASPLTTKPPRKSLQRFVMSFPWAWVKMLRMTLRMSSGVRIPKVEWVGHCTCFWIRELGLETVQGQLYTSVWVDPLSWSQGGILMTSYTVFSHPTVLTAHLFLCIFISLRDRG